MLQIASLLIHSQDVPPAARAALSTAFDAPAEQRRTNLLAAARILHRDSGLPCEDAMELVGLGDASCDD